MDYEESNTEIVSDRECDIAIIGMIWTKINLSAPQCIFTSVMFIIEEIHISD